MTQVVDMIVPRCPLLGLRAQISSWITEGLQMMERWGRWLGSQWRKAYDESDKVWARAHFKAYTVAVMLEKKQYSSATFVSMQCRAVELFWVVRGLLGSGL